MIKFVACIFVITTAVFLAELGYCRYVLADAVNADQILDYQNGVAFAKGETVPFTGAAYRSVCAEECGFMGCPSLHWYAQFENGKRAEMFLPESGELNDYFTISLFGGYQRVHSDSDVSGT